MALDHDWHLGQHRRDPRLLQCMPVDHAVRQERPVILLLDAMAECILATDIKAKVVLHAVTVLRQNPEHAAKMVEMPVAEDERVDRRDIDAEQFKVVVEHVGRVAEVEQDAPGVRALGRGQVQRQAPLALQGPAVECGRRAYAFHTDPWRLRTGDEDVVVCIEDHLDGQAVHDRRDDPNGCGEGRPVKDAVADKQRSGCGS